MPLYEYKCRKCGHRFEKIESFTASSTKKCPKCGAVAERMIGAPAIQFKGSGWYVTDYAGKSGTSGSSESSESGDKANSSEKSGDSKAADSKPADSKSAESKPAATTTDKGSEKRKKK